jgi:hypothetical protein
MAQLKPQKFLTESFPEQAKWIGSLFGALNQFINDVFLAFNNQLTVKENLFQEIKELTFKNITSNFPMTFKTKWPTNPQGLLLIYCVDNSIAKPPSVTPVVEWIYENGTIKITAIGGLNVGTSYTMRFLIVYE